MQLPIVPHEKKKWGIILLSVVVLIFIVQLSVKSYLRTQDMYLRDFISDQFDTLYAHNTHTSEIDKFTFKVALDLRGDAVQINDTALIVRITNFIASRYNGIGDYVNALKYYNLVPIKDDNLRKNILVSKSSVLNSMHKTDSALYYMNMARKYGMTYFMYKLKLGNIYLTADSIDRAEECYLEAQKFLKSNTNVYLSLAQIYEKKGDLNKSLRMYELLDSISRLAYTRNRYYRAGIYYAYYHSKILLKMGREDDAVKILKDNFKYLENNSVPLPVNETYRNEKFRDYYYKSLVLLDSIYNENTIKYASERISLKDTIIKKKIENYITDIEIDKSNISSYFDNMQHRYEVRVANDMFRRKLSIVMLYLGIYVVIIGTLAAYRIYDKRSKQKNLIIINEASKVNRYDYIKYSSEVDRVDPEKKFFNIFKNLESLMKNEKVYTNSSLNRKQLASILYTNENYLQSAIKIYANGITVSDYINTYRVNEACNYVAEHGNASVSDIVEECGFANRESFYKSFEKNMHISFREYKSSINSNF